jgi:hypothetical protein
MGSLCRWTWGKRASFQEGGPSTIGFVDIHQIQVRYLPEADRLLMQVRTRAGEQVSIWFTRRLMLRLWTPLQQLASRLAVARTAPDAVAVPEAREMLSRAARERVLEDADFKTPFDRTTVAQPLGAEPLLASQVELAPTLQQGMTFRIQEHRGRHLSMTLTASLTNAVTQLFERALAASEWNMPAVPPPAPVAPAEAPPAMLN